MKRNKVKDILKKYIHYIIYDFKEAIMYRLDMTVWMLIDIISPFVMIFVWIAAFKETADIQSFNVNSMVAYYLIANFCLVITIPNTEWSVLNQVKNGTLSTELLRPVDFFWRLFVGGSVFHAIRILVYIPFFIIMTIIFKQYIVLPEFTTMRVLTFVIGILISYFLNLSLKLILGTLAFWLVDCWGIFSTYNLVVQIMSGSLIPLGLLPKYFIKIADILPFKYSISTPVNFLLGNIGLSEYSYCVRTEFLWMIGACMFAYVFWRISLHRYEAVGG